MIYRRLLPHEWQRLEPIFREQGHRLPAFSGMPCFVAEEGGQIVGLLAMIPMPQLELWVREDKRGQGVARALCDEAQEEMMDEAPFLALARNDATRTLCMEFAMQRQEGVEVYMMPELGEPQPIGKED